MVVNRGVSVKQKAGRILFKLIYVLLEAKLSKVWLERSL